jgi:phosphatidylserine synthase
MEFHYYYLIQDILGVFLAFLGFRLSLLCIKMISINKLSKSSILVLIKYVLILCSGLSLLLTSFEIKNWIISIFIIFISITIKIKDESIERI